MSEHSNDNKINFKHESENPFMSGQLTPMMLQYTEIKDKYKDCILFYRLGDFYEMFFEDAVLASEELGIVLTGRDCGLSERAPLCGVPFHSADSYIAKLVQKGYKIAICEQMEKPDKNSKVPVRREVVRVVTPGTMTDTNYLDDATNNYIFCAYECADGFGIALCDISTGEFMTSSFSVLESNGVIDELVKFMPSEVIFNESFSMSEAVKGLLPTATVHTYDLWNFEYANALKALCEHFRVANLNSFGIEDNIPAIGASGALIAYLHQTQMNTMDHLNTIRLYTNNDFMPLDAASRRNLEISQSMRSGTKKGSLLGVLDKTTTSMGARLLKNWMEQPLIDAIEINKRLDMVEELKKDQFCREEIKDCLGSIYDIERLLSKIVYKSANAKDLTALKKSFEVLPSIKVLMAQLSSDYGSSLCNNLDPLMDLHNIIYKGIIDDPPFSIREGGFIKSGLNETLDRLRHVKNTASDLLNDFEVREREQTGIKNLKVKFNKVFGYSIEITNSFLGKVPDRYIRRQTLANAERYITEELRQIEDDILGADSKIVELEYDLFVQIRDEIEKNVQRIQKAAGIIATLDSLLSLAEVAHLNNYVRPEITNDGAIYIEGGRHPVVEKMSKATFVPNDTLMNLGNNRMSIITGPNMAGKSTYMRQVALITLMAQCGSFVPAQKASISICDRIFTRVGASDDLATGQSTFMVEMSEVANILNQATKNSLLILDEIGRGTSTYDGLSIAWAVLEYIANQSRLGAKTLFATHYHELTELEGNIDGVLNYRMSVRDYNGDIVFLRKIERGAADRSYGIHVARLAGIPSEVLYRSEEVMMLLLHEEMIKKGDTEGESEPVDYGKVDRKAKPKTLSDSDWLVRELIALDVDALSPRDALRTLYEFREKSRGE